MSAWLRIKRIFLNWIGRSGGYSDCVCCGGTWNWLQEHTTWHGPRGDHGMQTSGCFALCEECWRDLGNPEARLPYYRCCFGDRDTWPSIEKAVLEES